MKIRIWVSTLTLFLLNCGVGGFHWCSWSPCSASCGEGKQTRYKICGGLLDSSIHGAEKLVETKSCIYSFCPSYLSWPRLHFSGTLVADVSTVNNFRCNYHNKYFTPNKWTTHFGANLNYTTPPHHYKVQRTNWNPSGTGHAYFYNTTIKSLCTEAGSCSTSDGIVGSSVTELSHGRMVDLDTDWQLSPTIWGMTVSIPAVLQGEMIPSPSHAVGTRLSKLSDYTRGYIFGVSGFHKTKLTNVTWLNDHYKAIFKSSSSLSFTFVYDLYNQYSFDGRVSGTIGLTSDDDPVEMFAGRIMKSFPTTTYPFHLHENNKILVLDLSTYFKSDNSGLFNLDYGQLDLAMIVKTKDYCRIRRSYKLCMLKYGTKSSWYIYLTNNGALSQMVGKDSWWYLKYGGVIEVDLSHLKNSLFELLKRNRLTLLKKTHGSSTAVAVATEPIHGINVGIASSSIMRLNLNESSSYSTFVTQYGRPAHNVTVSIKVADKYSSSFYSCNMPVDCNRSLSTPADAIQMLPKKCTISETGLCNFNITFVKDPGPVRGCQMDGQVYPLNIWADYNHDGKTTKYMSGPTQSYQAGTHTSITQNTAVKIYNESPLKKCPAWEDVKYIFHQYHNLYPVMSQYGIINLMSYNDVRRKAKMLRVSMFETSVNDARYMPTTRDMSRSKRQLIKNWMDCGMKKEPTNPKQLQCNEETLNAQLNDTRVLLERAIMLELSTIPPYFTAWLSLKTQQGRNLEVAKILQSVYREEMLHMTLVSNLLNAIGGKVVLSSLVQLPQYATTLEFGEFFEIMPDKRVTIEPMSIEVVQDVFSAIEKPASESERKLMANIAKLWKLLPKEGLQHDDSVTLTMNHFIKTHSTSNETSSTNATLSWTRLKSTSSRILDAIKEIQISTISSFYTKIALQLAFVESCTKSLHHNIKNYSAAPTIFTGNPNKQLNQSYWFAEYNVDDDDVRVVNSAPKPSLFAVTDLKSALQAVVEVVYQGEGGSSCSPYVTSLHSKEYSHYYRFQEIVHGRKLIQVKQPPYWHASKCLNMSEQFDCPHLKQSGSDYCYLGKQVTFDKDGVWPLISNPQSHMYDRGTKAHRLNHEFNEIYSRLLLCLEEAFNGNPNKIKACMADMYSLSITGKKMVRTPIGIKGNSETVEIGQYEHNASPTWQFIPRATSTAGLPFKK